MKFFNEDALVFYKVKWTYMWNCSCLSSVRSLHLVLTVTSEWKWSWSGVSMKSQKHVTCVQWVSNAVMFTVLTAAQHRTEALFTLVCSLQANSDCSPAWLEHSRDRCRVHARLHILQLYSLLFLHYNALTHPSPPRHLGPTQAAITTAHKPTYVP